MCNTHSDVKLCEERNAGVPLSSPVEGSPTYMGPLKKPKPCHCEECGDVMQGGEHDEAISIKALEYPESVRPELVEG